MLNARLSASIFQRGRNRRIKRAKARRFFIIRCAKDREGDEESERPICVHNWKGLNASRSATKQHVTQFPDLRKIPYLLYYFLDHRQLGRTNAEQCRGYRVQLVATAFVARMTKGVAFGIRRRNSRLRETARRRMRPREIADAYVHIVKLSRELVAFAGYLDIATGSMSPTIISKIIERGLNRGAWQTPAAH